MSKSFASTRILVVEHDQNKRELLQTLLKQLGIGYCLATDSVSAGLESLLDTGNNFHVVFTGQDMPERDGLDFINVIRRQRQFDHVRIAMVSEQLTNDRTYQRPESQLRSFLQRKDVLQIPRAGLDAGVLSRALTEMTGP